MLPRVTPAVAEALVVAQHIGSHFQALDVQTVHLLHGLLYQEDGRAASILRDCGVDLLALRSSFTDWTAPADAAPGGATELPLSSGAQKALLHAKGLAAECSGERTIASEHLLLALLRDDERLRTELVERGLDFSKLLAAVETLHGPALELDAPLELVDPTEVTDTLRVLDANANRAREALRVLEDYCRFALDDAFLSRELKELRHDLTLALNGLECNALLAARDTGHDVGTTISTAAEATRHSALAVAQANCKRLQESLRSLEEYGKLHGPELGKTLEALRYRAYTVERALLLGTTARQRLAHVRLCVLVTGAKCQAAMDWTIREAIAGGAGMVQLREKELSDAALLERARLVRQWTREAGVLFILNDRPDLARLVGADGVHLGRDDLPVKEARRIVGPRAIIGVSTHDLDQVRQAIRDGAGYLGVGPSFPSTTKRFAVLAGTDFIREVTSETTLPAFAIGGISLETVGVAVSAGAQRVAVSHAICNAEDPRRTTADILRQLP